MSEPKYRIVNLMALVSTEEEWDLFRKYMGKAGWKITYQGHSGSWLGEPIYAVTKSPKEEEEEEK